MSDFPEVKDHLVANPDKYTMTTNPDGTVTLRPTWVDNPSEVLQEGTPVDAAFLSKIPEAIDAIDTKVTTQLADKMKKQESSASMLSTFYQKLMSKEALKIICQGDSLTYGQDTVSADKRAFDTVKADDGSSHSLQRAGKTYPEALGEFLNQVYGVSHTVINKGYSGDWVGRGITRWNTNSNADLAILMYGSNDSNKGASWVPDDVEWNVDRFVKDYRTLIMQYLKWGTPVILLTPPRLLNQETPTATTGIVAEPFRMAVQMLGKEFNCPVIDTEEFFNGYDNTYYADNVHFNTKGYTAFAARLVSVLVGYGEVNKVIVAPGNSLSIRTTRDSFVSNNVSLTTDPVSTGAEEGTDGRGLLATLNDNTSFLQYGFYLERDNTVLIPIFSNSSNSPIKVTLDFNTEQGSIPLTVEEEKTAQSGQKAPSSMQTSAITSNSVTWDGTINKTTTDRYLRIANRGWHTLRVENMGTGKIYFNGFKVISYKDLVAPSATNTNGFLHLPLYSAYSASPASVSELRVKVDDLKNIFKITPWNADFFKGIPLKVTLFNFDKCVIERGFIWHDSTTASAAPVSGFRDMGLLRKTDLVASPTNYRDITGITYDSSTREYVIAFSGNLTYLSSVVIQPI